jgi:sugar lactone lactonase YvrE
MQQGLALVLAVSILALVGFAATAAAAPVFPDVIPLPTGFQPEGIATGGGTTFFAGSLATGAVVKGDLRTGQTEMLVPPQAGRVAVGLAYDARTDALYVAGGPTGAAYVYNAATGAEIAEIQLAAGGSFVNDVIVTRDAVYFTDSFLPTLYTVPLAGSGAPSGTATALPLTGEFAFVPGGFNANGIEAAPDGTWLIVVNSTTGALYRVDPATGEASQIALDGEPVVQGDGLLLAGRTLYVVQNRKAQIAVIDLAPDWLSGTVAATITNADAGGRFRVPTTVAAFGNDLYAVNARFGVADPSKAAYEVVRVPR